MQDVVEKDRDVDGYHQALFGFPCDRCELEADGPVWRETIYRYVHEAMEANHTVGLDV